MLKKNKRIFLNHILGRDTPFYGNNGKVLIKKIRDIEKGDTSNTASIEIAGHSGTHIDAPYHFDQMGRKLSEFSADFWICNNPFLIRHPAQSGQIISLNEVLPELEKIPGECDLLIVKTGFEKFRITDTDKYTMHGPGWAPEVGSWLRKKRNIKMIGFDFISLSSFQNREIGRIAHRAFLSGLTDPDHSPVLIIEDMRLQDIENSPVSVIVSPFLFEDSDGAPVTVIAEIG